MINLVIKSENKREKQKVAPSQNHFLPLIFYYVYDNKNR